MKNFFICFLIALHSFNTKAEDIVAKAVYVDPPVKNKSGKLVIKIRNAKEDIFLNIDRLDKKTQELIKSADPKKAQNITYPSEAVISKVEMPMGIRPDCSEIPTNMDELGAIATSSKDMLDFLNKKIFILFLIISCHLK